MDYSSLFACFNYTIFILEDVGIHVKMIHVAASLATAVAAVLVVSWISASLMAVLVISISLRLVNLVLVSRLGAPSSTVEAYLIAW